jgi:feruloyl esterase
VRSAAALLLFAAAPALWAAAPAAAAGCDSLAAAAIPGATVTNVSTVTSLTAYGKVVTLPAPACQVLLTARPSADSDVRIAVLIPQGAAWNGKFVQVGNGGFAGQIPWGSLATALDKGYATAGTDDGHQDDDAESAKWALGHPEKVTDFGWRAVKTTTDVANAVLAAYGSPPRRRYFVGCSDGGREALMTAQRFPQDFDGIVAGAPAWPWTRLIGNMAAMLKQSLVPARALPPAKLPALQAAALRACGGGRYVADPRSCRFDPGTIACTAAETAECLTPTQVETVRMAQAGRTDPVTGRHFSGLVPGAEAQPGSWESWGVAAEPGNIADANGRGFAWNFFAFLVKDDRGFDLRTLTDADIIAGYKRLGATLDADNPDLGAFKARGGKLLGFHGWNDPAIPPGLSVEYFKAVQQATPGTDDFYRLFMVPGMLHCRGGDAPVDVDWFAEIDRWVETGKAPATLVATNPDGRSQALAAER